MGSMGTIDFKCVAEFGQTCSVWGQLLNAPQKVGLSSVAEVAMVRHLSRCNFGNEVSSAMPLHNNLRQRSSRTLGADRAEDSYTVTDSEDVSSTK